MTIKNEILKNTITIKYDELISYKKNYHIKGTFNKYNSWYITGIIDKLQSDIDSLQGLLESYNNLDRANANRINVTYGMNNEVLWRKLK